MITPRFKSNKAKLAAGIRPVDFRDDGTMFVLVPPRTWSEIYLDAGTVAPPAPVDLPPVVPPVVVVPPIVTPPVAGITPATLVAAIAAAKAGDTLLLGAGSYVIPAGLKNITLKSVVPGAARVTNRALNAAAARGLRSSMHPPRNATSSSNLRRAAAPMSPGWVPG